MITMQEIFDNALFGVRGQGYMGSMKPDDPETCAYAGADGMHCGIGHTLAKQGINCKALDDGLQFTSISSVLQEPFFLCESEEVKQAHAAAVKLFEGIDVEFLEAVQRAHDSTVGYNPENSNHRWVVFEHGMQSLAVQYGLIYTPPEVKL